jgi:hypothetical protein
LQVLMTATVMWLNSGKISLGIARVQPGATAFFKVFQSPRSEGPLRSTGQPPTPCAVRLRFASWMTNTGHSGLFR